MFDLLHVALQCADAIRDLLQPLAHHSTDFLLADVGSVLGLVGQKKAISAQERAADQANALQQDMYEQSRADQQGYRDRGDLAGNQIAMLLGLKSMDGTRASWGKGGRFGEFSQALSPGQITKEPGYQFGLQQGNDAITRAAAAGGGVYSGATLKALQRYGQDYAGTKYNEAYGRARNNRLDQFNMLASLSGLGQVATGQTQQANMNYGNNVSSNLIGLGNAQGAYQTSMWNTLQNERNQAIAAFTGGMGGFGGMNSNPLGGWMRNGTSGD